MKDSMIKVLLIEDNSGDARLLQELLNEMMQRGEDSTIFKLQIAERLSTAFRLLEQSHFDIILLDLFLPDSQGLDTLMKIQKRIQHIPIVVLSGLDDESISLEAVRAGAQDYIFKNELNGYILVRALQYSLERKRAEEALKKANRKLKELDKLKSDFLSTVSHELRTPIAIMREGVSLCLEGVAGTINEKQKELLNATLENTDRLTRLVTDLLDISKIEAGKMVLRRISIDMVSLIKKIADSYYNLMKEKNISLRIQVPDQPVHVYADPDKVTQIFNNLINNALKFTNHGGKIVIGTKDKRDCVECWVKDTGIGIAKENIKKLFSKFEQIGRIDGPGYQGTGLGLAIAKGLTQKHHGHINVQSELGKGTTFKFTLKKVSFPKILIVDDEENVVEIIKELLFTEKYRFIEAYNGRTAIDLALKESPDLILLDMNLPEMNGYEVIGRLNQDMRTKHIPLIIITAYSVDKERLDQLSEQVAFPVLTKPFERDELLKTVKDMLVN